jgi:hypothetical protein
MAKARSKKSTLQTLEDMREAAQRDELLALLGDNPRMEDIDAAIALERGRNAPPSPSRAVEPRFVGERPEPGLPGEYYVNRGRAQYRAEQSSLDDLVRTRAEGAVGLEARAAKRIAAKTPRRAETLRRLKWKTAGKWGGRGLAALGAYQLLDAGREAYTNRKLTSAIEDLPEPSPQDYLDAMHEQELLARREARLMRNDPEAYAILRGVAGGKSPKNGPAMDAVRIGGTPMPPELMDQNTQDLLSSLLRD